MPLGTDRADEARRQGRLWTPAVDRARLVCWHSAEDSAVTYATGISNWSDLSGKGFDAIQATGASQPTLSVDPRRRVLTSSTQKLVALTSAQAATYLNDTNPWTMFVVFERVGTATYPVPFGTDQVSPGDAREIYLDHTLSYQIAYGTNGFGIAGTVNANLNERNIAVVSTTTTSVSTLRTNGAQSSSGSVTQRDITTGFGYNGKGNLSIYAYEGGLYSATLSKAECERLEGYLAWRNNAQSRLDASHPFKNRPPLIGD